jgi:SAM-dependent methyltransferase
MLQPSPYIENLRDIAARAYGLANTMCGSCRDLHALWAYIRLSRMSSGTEGKGSLTQARLSEFMARGLRDVLIAGSQDTGLLALAANAGQRAGTITVLDICGTPLALCRALAEEWSLPIETIERDLRGDLGLERRFDLVLVHGTLQFIDAPDRLRALAGINRALRPGGKLVLQFNTSRRIAAEDAERTRMDYANGVLAELEKLDIPLPDERETMRRRLIAHAERREQREGSFAEPGVVERLLAAAGFEVEECTAMDVNVAPSGGSMMSAFAKWRFMAVAGVKRRVS